MTAPTYFDAVIRGLSQDQNLTRIKKLLLYLCKNQWENDPARLHQVELQDLVQRLLYIAPSLEQLKARLNKVVKALNKPAEYALVANAIVNHLKPLYASESEPTQVVSSDSHYAPTVALLEGHPQAIRIRKILFCACNGRWENDPTILNEYSLEGLIQRLHLLTPSIEELKAVLYSIVKTLNRQSEYTLIASVIVEAMTPLYVTVGGTTHILLAAPPTAAIEPLPSVSPSPPTQQVLVHSAPEIPPTRETVAELPKEPPDLFDLRLEVMKYTSPLRAKVLLHSILYQSVDATDEGWMVVRSHDLDELLQNALDHYLTQESLEVALKETAKTLSDSNQYLQAAGAILRAVRSWYDYTASNHHDSQVSGGHSLPHPSTAPAYPVAPVQLGSPLTPEPEDTCLFLSPSGKCADTPEDNPDNPDNPHLNHPAPPQKVISQDVISPDHTLDLASSSIHQDITLGLPQAPTQTEEDTGLFNAPPDFDERG